VAVVSRPGKHLSLVDPSSAAEDAEMEVAEEGVETGKVPAESLPTSTASLAPLLLQLAESPGRFASTMMTMDGPLL
jgi:hypothetical protein